ncbi:hypothetical protein L2E82_10250 [Cichorium intybus]|uniref:Uncharacterized protein n=1 Tax=Cichorium intybus TaxID=13427 RepID=A0ACB9GAM2_CICIN|nr:hypothetical protein L2E82_10250 [Cichorium intybus]
MEFDNLDYETLRALDSDSGPTTNSMSEEDVNYLPVHKYKVANFKVVPRIPSKGKLNYCNGTCIKLEPEDVGNYVMLSNIYADLGRWDGVSRVRKLIRGKIMSKMVQFY